MKQPLSESDIERFLRDGFTVVRDAFSRDVAAQGREFIWKRLGLSPDRPEAWIEPFIHIRENYSAEPFCRVMNPRLRAAFDQLMGPERWIEHDRFGWWPILFPGFATPPKPDKFGWHVDGSNFHHRLTSKAQGLVTLFLFSDIGPGGGGTAMLLGSHRDVARILADAEPEGLAYETLLERLPHPDLSKLVEATGAAGDVVLMHPFTIHAVNANSGNQVRIACNPQFQLREPMQLLRPDGAYSAVERATRFALSL